MKKKIILGISILIIIAVAITVLVVATTKSKNVETVADTVINTGNVEGEKEDNTLVIVLEDTPSLGGEKEEINIETLESQEAEEQLQEMKEAETEPENVEKQEEFAQQDDSTQKQSNPSNDASTGSSPYYIKVNNQANVVTIYGKDENGYYTRPIKAMICSTGTVTPPSERYPSNKYTIKGRWEWLELIGDVYGHYATQITGNILFHSVPYTEKWNPGSLEYWEYDKLRYSMFSRMC